MVQVVWFKRDLRVEDHRPLLEAARAGAVLPLHVVEPAYWRGPDASPRQWRFLRAALTDLRARLAALGAPLVVRVGEVEAVLADLHARHGIARLLSHEETGNLWTFARDRRVGDFCRAHGIPWDEHRQFAVRRGGMNRDGWARFFAATMAGEPLPAPPRLAPTDEPPGDIPGEPLPWTAEDGLRSLQPAGRAEALRLLDGFFAGRGADYRRGMSSPLSAPRACSRLSPHLALGTLSLREVVRRTEDEIRALSAMPPALRPIPVAAAESFLSRLHWHDHFIQKLEAEPELERRSAHPAAEAARVPTAPDDPLLLAWAEGRTGFPFLDACMRSLIATGWLNFRMRAMVQAIASYHLALDWQASGARLARLFVDYEPGIHWPQVQMQSGQTGINTPRIYNPVKQSLDQDPEGVFIARWVPEVAHLPPALRHAPWKAGAYIAPVMDHEAAARAAKARLSAIRREPGFREESRRVYERHGSRARPFDARRPEAPDMPARAPARQLSLGL
ncbi:MAG: deoxyribodipyrimidine photo-lyase [Acetobacteraceae bacterium]|nr:deoxyribodipyrimidine photo-lyase [Acetobacteraceae bacterium]